jgi:hypothetical protein
MIIKGGGGDTVNLIPQFSAIKNKIKQGPSDKIKQRNQMMEIHRILETTEPFT